MTTTADCTIDVLLAISQQLYSVDTEPLVRSITRTLLFTSTSKLHCLVSTVLLLPKLLVDYSCNDALDLGYLWRIQGNLALSAALSMHTNKDNAQWLSELCPLLMQSMAEPEEEKLVVEILLTILMGRCSVLLSPTLEFLQGLVGSAPVLFWKRNATLLSCLTRLIRTTNASDSSWPMLVKILTTLVPSE
ncbi:hypothetical protein THRCLA_11760 [Thraustotheca clavata]|uniref:Uncharacterized protein n=1 Tax=Thraustotheca clavata TaxID=74557 RepID=A0A1V9Y6V2_9STRA|nr:hypothetical protein THRCLA_11760 [Thraustotheca clavata]